MTAAAYRFHDTGQSDPASELRGGTGRIWRSTDFQVVIADQPGGWVWLSIKRNDREAIRSWRVLQAIKNHVADGAYAHRDALELFPAQDRTVDGANQRHLFVMPAGQHFPFGFPERAVYDHDADLETIATEAGIPLAMLVGAKQRPFADDGLTGDML